MIWTIGRSPRQLAFAFPQLPVKLVQSMARRLRHPNHLLQQITQVLNMLRFLAQEARLDCILGRRIVVLHRNLAHPDKVLRQSLLNLQCLVHRLNRVNGIIGPLDLRCGNVAWATAAASLEQIEFEPVGVSVAFGGAALPKPMAVQ